MREFSIHFQDYVCFICVDDKHKVPIREGVTTSTGVRNKKSIVLQNVDLVACDHDFTKLSLTPSVIFFCEVPRSIEESFYSGKVFFSIPPILCLYTDGGPDHGVTYKSVQISLFCLFLKGNFDMLIALRTAPHQSWNNPAERIMSILNLALQVVALVCETIAAEKSSQLAGELQSCIIAIQEFLHERTERLVLHDEPFSCYDPADKSEISLFFETILAVDRSLNINKTTADILSKKELLQKFIETHCHQQNYSFQHIFAILDFLSDPTPSIENNDHYANFHTVYRNTTTEDYHPTLMQAMKSSERVPNRIFVNTKVRDYIEYFQCVEEDHEFYNKVFVRENITYEIPIKLAYYSSNSRRSNHNTRTNLLLVRS
ncbi:hypothetical protein GLOIN_2v1882875 [Rhizophagus clarus]|uniref:Uncharacterized protein n=1 Tax=Rhizophagus clarus TaxID=94130 RepID=A0A8H3QJU8_9GLOM|nr:hypothetical protein GLOIN_2v1882875 [Rhizophagus clarus]